MIYILNELFSLNGVFYLKEKTKNDEPLKDLLSCSLFVKQPEISKILKSKKWVKKRWKIEFHMQ